MGRRHIRLKHRRLLSHPQRAKSGHAGDPGLRRTNEGQKLWRPLYGLDILPLA